MILLKKGLVQFWVTRLDVGIAFVLVLSEAVLVIENA